MTPHTDALLGQFQGAYGRLCLLVAAALHRGCLQDQVLKASRGQGIGIGRTYAEMRKQRARLNGLIRMCRDAGLSDETLIEAMGPSRVAVEQEFGLRIPRM